METNLPESNSQSSENKNQSTSVGAEPSITIEPPSKNDKTSPQLKKILTWASVIIGSLAIGFFLAYFLLYRPAMLETSRLNGELNTATTQISSLENQLADANTELTDARAQYGNAASELTSVSFELTLAKLKQDIILARLAYNEADNLTARQALSQADTHLAELIPLIKEAETAKVLQERLTAIHKVEKTNSKKALEELRIFSENLSQIEAAVQ